MKSFGSRAIQLFDRNSFETSKLKTIDSWVEVKPVVEPAYRGCFSAAMVQDNTIYGLVYGESHPEMVTV